MRYYVLHVEAGLTPFIEGEILGDLDDSEEKNWIPRYPVLGDYQLDAEQQVLSWPELNKTAEGQHALADWTTGNEDAARAWLEDVKRRINEQAEREKREFAEQEHWTPQQLVNDLLSHGISVSDLGEWVTAFYESRNRPFPPELAWTLKKDSDTG